MHTIDSLIFPKLIDTGMPECPHDEESHWAKASELQKKVNTAKEEIAKLQLKLTQAQEEGEKQELETELQAAMSEAELLKAELQGSVEKIHSKEYLLDETKQKKTAPVESVSKLSVEQTGEQESSESTKEACAKNPSRWNTADTIGLIALFGLLLMIFLPGLVKASRDLPVAFLLAQNPDMPAEAQQSHETMDIKSITLSDGQVNMKAAFNYGWFTGKFRGVRDFELTHKAIADELDALERLHQVSGERYKSISSFLKAADNSLYISPADRETAAMQLGEAAEWLNLTVIENDRLQGKLPDRQP